METTLLRHCPECAHETAFATPDCVDGHADCPDLMCLECGLALTGLWVVEAEVELSAAAA